MSNFTTEVRFICETACGYDESQGADKVEEIIESCAENFFPSYPIFDEDYRKPLNIKILRHFYTREIGYETVGLWKLKLKARMEEIMPYYNQLYLSTKYEFDPLTDVDVKIDRNGKVAGLRKNEGESNSENKTVDRNSSSGKNDTLNMFADTPQGGVQNLFENENDEVYLTNASKNKVNANRNDIGESNGESKNKTKDVSQIVNTEDYVERIVGKRGGESYSGMIKEFRKNMLNVDMMVIDELESLFMGLWE